MIGKAVYSILSSSTALVALVGTKMYPVVMPENTTAPCIVWRVTGAPEYTKSSTPHDVSNVTFMIFDDDYTDLLAIAEVVRTELEDVRGVYNGVTVVSGRISNYLEDYDREAALFLYQFNITFKHK